MDAKLIEELRQKYSKNPPEGMTSNPVSYTHLDVYKRQTQHIIYQRHQIFQGFHYLFSDLLLHLWIICVLISHIYHTDNTIQWCTDIMTHRCQKPCFHFGFPLCCFRSKVKILVTSLGIADTTDRT